MNEEEIKKLFGEVKDALTVLLPIKDMAEKYATTEKELRDELKAMRGNFESLEASGKATQSMLDEAKKSEMIRTLKEGHIGIEEQMDFGRFVVDTCKYYGLGKGPGESSHGAKIAAFQSKYGMKTNPLNITTDAEGALLVPDPFATVISRVAAQKSIFLHKASQLTITKGNALPNLTLLTDAAVYWPAEGSLGTAIEPTFAESDTKLVKLTGLSRVNNELIEDEEIGLLQFMVIYIGELMGSKIDNEGFLGDGTQFYGICEATGINTVDMDAGKEVLDVTYDDLINVEAATPVGVLPNCAYYMSLGVLCLIKKLKDGFDRPIWMPPAGDQPATINGYPVIVAEQMPAATNTATDGDPVLAFGDLSKYAVATKGGLSVIVDKSIYVLNDRTVLAWRRRMAMKALVASAFTVLHTNL